MNPSRNSLAMKYPASGAAVDVIPAGHNGKQARKPPEKLLPLSPSAGDRVNLSVALLGQHDAESVRGDSPRCQEVFLEIITALKLLRKKRGWTSEESMARALGLTYAAVSAWHRGRNRPHPAMLDKLAGICSGDLAEFFRRESGLPSNESFKPRAYNILVRAADMLLEAAERGNGAAMQYLEHYADEMNKRAVEVGTLPAEANKQQQVPRRPAKAAGLAGDDKIKARRKR